MLHVSAQSNLVYLQITWRCSLPALLCFCCTPGLCMTRDTIPMCCPGCTESISALTQPASMFEQAACILHKELENPRLLSSL